MNKLYTAAMQEGGISGKGGRGIVGEMNETQVKLRTRAKITAYCVLVFSHRYGAMPPFYLQIIPFCTQREGEKREVFAKGKTCVFKSLNSNVCNQ